MDESGLKIYSYIEVPSSGYPGEEVDSDNSAPKDPGAEGEWHPFVATYYYRDSNLLPVASNDSSSRVDVTIVQEYNYKKTLGNHYQITVRGYLTEIKRGDFRTSAGPIQHLVGRTIQVWGVNGNSVWGPTQTYPDEEKVYFSGRLSLGEKTYDLKPGKSTPLDSLAADYRSYTTGYWTGAIPSPFLDQMHMGLMFENTLPDKCDAPSLITVTQNDDICDNTVEACLTFDACSCDGMGLVVEYMFGGDTWEGAKAKGQSVQIDASYVSKNTICLSGLPPTNHTKTPTILYWRAKFVPVTSDMPETEWTTGNLNMIFILAPHETVPDINPQECMNLQRGTLIDKYEQEVCYNEYGCADITVNVNSTAEDTRSCEIINGVSNG